METKDYHVIHFDGHGLFGRQCPKCGKIYYPHYQTCIKGCQTSLEKPLGFLQFEDMYKQREWIDCNNLFYLLSKTSVRLVVLSACFSGTVYGETVFSGVAPTLLECGVPCVVGMQFSIYDEHANLFIKAFYKSLAEAGNVRQATQAGRRGLIYGNEKSWHIPVLYLRSKDFVGQLFGPQNIVAVTDLGRTTKDEKNLQRSAASR